MLHRGVVRWNPWEKVLAILAAFAIITLILLLKPHSKLERDYTWVKDFAHADVKERAPSPVEPARHEILKALEGVHDPEISVNIVDLGLVYGVEVDAQKVMILLTVTSPKCPFAATMVRDVRDALFGIPSVREVHVRLTLDPPWTVDKVSKEARNKLIGIPVGVGKEPQKGPA
jgi:metal-sulfur cluster biosynthetic enzyme